MSPVKYLSLLVLLTLSPAPALAETPAAQPVATADPVNPQPEEIPGLTLESGGESLHVVVTPGGRQLESMAVPDLNCDGGEAGVCSAVTQILRRDMLLSFFFVVLPPRSYLADMTKETLTETSWKDWNNIGARWLIKGEAKGTRVTMRLYNVVREAEVPVNGSSFDASDEKALRKGTHTFANGVLEAITGTPGVFGTKIAYHYKGGKPGRKGIGIIEMDGGGRDGLITNKTISMLPTWGPGGLYYTSFRDGKPDIYNWQTKISKDGGHYRRVAVGPDGKLIASIAYGGQSDLYLMDASGNVLRNLTNTAADEVCPVFSPDGSKVAFMSSQSGGPHIWVMNAGGGGMRRLTMAGSYNFSPDWGPNGLIVFAGMEGGIADIFTVDLGGNMARLTQDQGSNKDPTWSPDGRYIFFVSTREGDTGFWLMSADGRYQIKVAKAGGVGGLTWQK